MKMSLCALVAAAVLGLVGCNRGNTLPDEAAGDGAFGDAGGQTSGVGDGGGIGVTPLTPEEANVQLRLEGHADERGSREYNIGLGERRAQAVRRVLMLQGAAQTQITTVSYGEERPAQTGTDEESWRLNRRVELVYR
jgi:hypothetical protein